MDTIQIKKIETDDETRGMGYVLYKAWHETYEGILEEEFLSEITLEKGERVALLRKENSLIAKCKEKVVGFVGFGKYRDDEEFDAGEIYSIYILKDFKRKQIGCKMINLALDKLSIYNKVFLWVLEENYNAIAFYKKCGFSFDGEQKIVNLGSEKLELRMVYHKV